MEEWTETRKFNINRDVVDGDFGQGEAEKTLVCHR